MHEEFDAGRSIYVIVDHANAVRAVSHRQKPQPSSEHTPQLAAHRYLRDHAQLLGLEPQELKNLGRGVERTPVQAGLEYRLDEEKRFFDVTTVGYYQTFFGLPVWRSGLAVHVKHAPLRILAATSTAHRDVKPAKPDDERVRRFQKVGSQELQGILKLSPQNELYDLETLRVNRRRLLVYRYDADDRLPPAEDPRHGQPFPHSHPTLPLPPVDQGIVPGRHYVAAELLFTLALTGRRALNWVALVDVQTESILYLRALVDNVGGMVFLRDPMTQTGSAANSPSATTATLNPLRTTVTLANLAAPSGGQQALSGTWVAITDHEGPVVAPPTNAVGTDFTYDVRTDDFAAVNAYYHVDRFFQLVADLGFPVTTYFNGTSFPVSVDHRGNFGVATGIEINASCGGNATSDGIGLPDFELADLSDTTNPLGIAADWRVVLHEFGGHGILWDHVGSANFGFAHSAGDSFAAILNDPDSQASDRFQTFPWLGARRHDRDIASGWAWEGSNDTGSYNSEQILSTTHFRIYRSIGGDSTWLPTQEFAAQYAAWLILRAVGTLTAATNPGDATGFESALLTADLDDWTSAGHAGGAYGKVIRWAFEKQGMFQPAGAATPVTTEGDPPAVDVYIDDGRGGEYEYLAVHWQCPNIWNRLAPDGGTTHETPIVGVSNYAYVKIKNRGTQTATNVVVKGYHCVPSSGLVWPSDWQAMATPQLSAPDVAPNDTAEITVGPFEWVPSQIDHECMLMIVSATGDASNVDNFTAGDSIPEWRLVPHDNNIGQRNVAPVPGGGGLRGLMSAFGPRRFVVRNPHDERATIQIVPRLPAVLRKRGWQLRFENPGGQVFTLAPGQSREIVLRLQPGTEFTADEVARDPDRTIVLETVANGILIGGMSYELDPGLEVAAPQLPPKGEGRDCSQRARALLDRLDLPVKKVKDVRIRKITLDIEIEEERDC